MIVFLEKQIRKCLVFRTVIIIFLLVTEKVFFFFCGGGVLPFFFCLTEYCIFMQIEGHQRN